MSTLTILSGAAVPGFVIGEVLQGYWEGYFANEVRQRLLSDDIQDAQRVVAPAFPLPQQSESNKRSVGYATINVV